MVSSTARRKLESVCFAEPNELEKLLALVDDVKCNSLSDIREQFGQQMPVLYVAYYKLQNPAWYK